MSTEDDLRARRRELMGPTKLTWVAVVVMFGGVILLYALPDDAGRNTGLLILIVAGMALYLYERVSRLRSVRRRWAEEDAARGHDITRPPAS